MTSYAHFFSLYTLHYVNNKYIYIMYCSTGSPSSKLLFILLIALLCISLHVLQCQSVLSYIIYCADRLYCSCRTCTGFRDQFDIYILCIVFVIYIIIWYYYIISLVSYLPLTFRDEMSFCIELHLFASSLSSHKLNCSWFEREERTTVCSCLHAHWE